MVLASVGSSEPLKEFPITFAGAVQIRNKARYLPSSNVIQQVHRARCVNSQ